MCVCLPHSFNSLSSIRPSFLPSVRLFFLLPPLDSRLLPPLDKAKEGKRRPSVFSSPSIGLSASPSIGLSVGFRETKQKRGREGTEVSYQLKARLCVCVCHIHSTVCPPVPQAPGYNLVYDIIFGSLFDRERIVS